MRTAFRRPKLCVDSRRLRNGPPASTTGAEAASNKNPRTASPRSSTGVRKIVSTSHGVSPANSAPAMVPRRTSTASDAQNTRARCSLDSSSQPRASKLVVARDSPRSESVNSMLSTHASVRMPKRASPSRPMSTGMATKAASAGKIIPARFHTVFKARVAPEATGPPARELTRRSGGPATRVA